MLELELQGARLVWSYTDEEGVRDDSFEKKGLSLRWDPRALSRHPQLRKSRTNEMQG